MRGARFIARDRVRSANRRLRRMGVERDAAVGHDRSRQQLVTAVNPNLRATASEHHRNRKGGIMNRYQPLEFRTAFGAAALALTVLTMALAVGVPARMATVGYPLPRTGAHVASAATEVTLAPIEVVGVRETDIAASPVRTHNPRG
jgi:hypothetical protein